MPCDPNSECENMQEMATESNICLQDEGNGHINAIRFVKGRKTKKGELTFWATVVHLLIGGMSPTLLNLPATFHQVGYVVGFIGSFLIVLFYAQCMHIIVSCEKILCQRLHKVTLSYWQVLYYSLTTGPPATRWLAGYAKPLTYTIFSIIWAGGNATYVLLICENVKSVLKFILSYEVTDRNLVLWLTTPLVLLCWLPDLKAMVCCSLLSNMLNATSIVVILYVVTHNSPFFSQYRIPFGDASKVPYFLSLVFLTVNGTALILSLKSQMREPAKFGGTLGVINVSYVPTGALYAIFGLLCYLKYGEMTQEPVILNLPANTFGCFLQTMYALAVLLFYPLVTHVTFEILWNETPKNWVDGSPNLYFLLRYAVKTINALISVVLAYMIPNIALFISLIGSVCVALDSIILPATIEWLVHWEKRSFLLQVKTSVLITLGVVLMMVGFNASLTEIVQFYSK